MKTRWSLVAPLAALVLVAAACGSESTPTEAGGSGGDSGASQGGAEPPTDSPVFEAVEFGFSGPDEVAAGKVTVSLENRGKQRHQITMVELLEQKTIADVQALLDKGAPGKPPKWVRMVKGHAQAKPGASDDFRTKLTPGDYVMLCFITDVKTKAPHAALGMIKPLTAT